MQFDEATLSFKMTFEILHNINRDVFTKYGTSNEYFKAISRSHLEDFIQHKELVLAKPMQLP